MKNLKIIKLKKDPYQYALNLFNLNIKRYTVIPLKAKKTKINNKNLYVKKCTVVTKININNTKVSTKDN